MRIQTQHGALLVDSSHPATYIESFGPWPFSRVGVGDLSAGLDPQNQMIAGIASTAISTTAGILVAIGTIGGPVGAAIAGVAAIGVAIANVFAGCGQTCVQASNIANQVGDILAQNLNHYMASPIHYRSLQLAALNNFDIAWESLVQACGNAALQQAGQNCIADRQQGACKWKASPGGWQKDSSGRWQYVSPGPAGSGDSCWNYFVGMRDPIANDPTVVPDPGSMPDGTLSDALTGQSTVMPGGNAVQMVGQSSSLPMPLLLGAGGLALYLLLGRKN